MTQEDKQLLLKDLCARLAFGVVLDNPNPCGGHWDELTSIDIPKGTVTLLYDGRIYKVEEVKPYLRPMSSMTEEEKEEYNQIAPGVTTIDYIHIPKINQVDWLNAHHFDYRGLIEKGLALVAPENMYYENNSL